MMTFIDLAFVFKQWQASIFVRLTGVSHSLKVVKTQFSKASSRVDSEIPDILRHSQREYCSFAQHFLSTKISSLVSRHFD